MALNRVNTVHIFVIHVLVSFLNKMFIVIVFPGMGTFVFDARLGLYENPPNEQGMTFIQALHSYMEHSQKLVFNPISKISSQYFETPTLKTFLNSADILYGTGKELVNRRRAELEEMAEKGNDPTGGTQGTLHSTGFNPLSPNIIVQILLTGLHRVC